MEKFQAAPGSVPVPPPERRAEKREDGQGFRARAEARRGEKAGDRRRVEARPTVHGWEGAAATLVQTLKPWNLLVREEGDRLFLIPLTRKELVQSSKGVGYGTCGFSPARKGILSEGPREREILNMGGALRKERASILRPEKVGGTRGKKGVLVPN